MTLLQKIFITYGEAYLEKYADRMPPLHKKALMAIINCRTPAMGGQLFYCQRCKQFRYSYHSCGNRHCVICQNTDAGEWLKRQKQLLLPMTFFLLTFTLPEQLRPLARKNQKLFYTLLFKAAAYALKHLAKDEKYLGVDEVGMLGILHTWTKALLYHPHVHFLMPGGGMVKNNKSIRFSRDDFLVHVKPLSKIFQAKLRDLLKENDNTLFNTIPKEIWQIKWVIHCKAAGNGENTLLYLARYVFRVAITNSRIIKLRNNQVTFTYKNSKTGRTDVVTVNAFEFIRRFLQHVLPYQFIKVRYYGFYASVNKEKLNKLRKLLFVDEVTRDKSCEIAQKYVCCHICGCAMIFVENIMIDRKIRSP